VNRPTKITRLCALPVLLLAAGVLHAHGGGVDGYGCHNDRKSGGYHCHSGPLAGQKFSSQAEMLAKLDALDKKASLEERLQELKDLHDKQLISDEEYAQQRERVLGGL